MSDVIQRKKVIIVGAGVGGVATVRFGYHTLSLY